jgi:hypothetical protein
MYRTRFTLFPLAVAIVVTYCGLGLIKTALVLNGTVGEFMAGLFLILVGVWMAFSVIHRGSLR